MRPVFSSKTVITNPEELFGKENVLKQLIYLANNGNSVAIIGVKRFGKTSLIKCLETSLNSDEKSKVYPIYFDFKEVGSIVKGTDNVFKFMIARFVSKLYCDSHFREELSFKKIKITASKDWEDVYDGLINVDSVRIQSVFEEIITFFSEYLEKSILFLIDEYEWLFRFSFDQPVGFMKLRNFTSKRNQNGSASFGFWIAGNTSWNYLCTITGSPELNVIDAPVIYVNEIDRDSFAAMWEEELNKLETVPEQLLNKSEFVYEASGGIPFYGKLIGNQLLTSNEVPTYKILKHHFQELFDTLFPEEKTILTKLSQSSAELKNSKYLLDLVEKGLVIKGVKQYEIRSLFFKEFVYSLAGHDSDGFDRGFPECQMLSDKIFDLILNINHTSKNKNDSYIFEPVVDDAALAKDLRTPCYSSELFADFASSLYKIVFEKTKGKRSGKEFTKEKLPVKFKKNNQFIDIVDIMRHSLGKGHLMDTFIHRKGQLTKVQMLEILIGNKNEPITPEDFYNLQLATLKLFDEQLNILSSIVRS